MKKIFASLMVTLTLGTTQFAPAHAFSFNVTDVTDVVKPELSVLAPLMPRFVEDAAKWPVKPSQAAIIAQEAHPGSIVLGVKLLPSGQYAVTLRIGGSVQKVLVDATSGATG